MNIITRAALALSLLASIAPLAASAAPQAISTGAFVSGAHDTAGTATIYKLDDGSRIVRLENFTTSNGPAVHVVLTDHAVSGVGVDVLNAKSIDLGDLKATSGNQNYVIPADAKLDDIKAVSIWCERFHVNFGAATLK